MSPSPATAAPLPFSKLLILVAFGALLWLLGMLFLRWTASVGALVGTGQLLIYAITIPVTIPLIPLSTRIAGLPREYTLRAVAILAMTALINDGIVIGYFPQLYSSNPATARAAAGCLLWAVGVALVLALRVPDRAA